MEGKGDKRRGFGSSEAIEELPWYLTIAVARSQMEKLGSMPGAKGRDLGCYGGGMVEKI